ncbi:MAG: lipopolysaccharide biosynthesis protein [Bacteroidota bacterium]
MTRLLSLLRGPRGLSLAAQGASAVLGFAGFALVARTLSPEGFGAWVLYLTVATFFDMLRSGLVQAAYVQRASGAAPREAVQALGAAWTVALTATLVIASLGALAGVLGGTGGLWDALAAFPVLVVAALPHTVASWRAQAEERFGRILALRLMVSAGFVGAVLILRDGLTVGTLAWAHAGVHAAVSLLAMRWAGLGALRQSTQSGVRALLRFGRFSAITTVGANLLRSADALILGAVLGPAAVALYGVPQKLVEAAEVPIRGLAGAAFPALARSAREGEDRAFSARLGRDVGSLTLLLLPAVVLGWVFAPEATAFLGGEAYAEAGAAFRWFLLYALLLPADRFLGLALDALGRPHLNTLKVGAMLGANLAGDALVLALGSGVTEVAAVTVAMTAVGVMLGGWLVSREVPLTLATTRPIPSTV